LTALSDALSKGGLPSLKRLVVDSKHEQLEAACSPRGINLNPFTHGVTPLK